MYYASTEFVETDLKCLIVGVYCLRTSPKVRMLFPYKKRDTLDVSQLISLQPNLQVHNSIRKNGRIIHHAISVRTRLISEA